MCVGFFNVNMVTVSGGLFVKDGFPVKRALIKTEPLTKPRYSLKWNNVKFAAIEKLLKTQSSCPHEGAIPPTLKEESNHMV